MRTTPYGRVLADVHVLPQLDGTARAAVARLDAWLHGSAERPAAAALANAESALRECTEHAVPALIAARDCDSEVCTGAEDAKTLGKELDEALADVRAAQSSLAYGSGAA